MSGAACTAFATFVAPLAPRASRDSILAAVRFYTVIPRFARKSACASADPIAASLIIEISLVTIPWVDAALC